MTWRDNLRPASFRGARCHTEDRRKMGGRRNVHHEYPKRDQPAVEDFGRRQRRWRQRCYCIGATYMAERDAMLDALERGGPGTFVDHWTGEHRVVVDDFTMIETREEGGFVLFEIDFAEAGGAAAPIALAGAASLLIGGAAAGLVNNAVSQFRSRFNG